MRSPRTKVVVKKAAVVKVEKCVSGHERFSKYHITFVAT